MARRPRRVQAQPAPAQRGEEGHHRRRPLRDGLRFVVRRAMARGGLAVRALLRPLRPLCRAVALGGRHLLLRLRLLLALGGRHLLRPLRLLWRGLELGGHALQRRALALGRRLLVARVRRQAAVYEAGDGEPRTPPKPKAQGSAILYDRRGGRGGRRPRPPSPRLPPPPQPTSPPPVVVDGEVVPMGVHALYVKYCSARLECPEKSTVCHFCMFEIQRSQYFMVPTSEMFLHCRQFHSEEGASVRCNVAGCSVRVRPGQDFRRHLYFCHQLPPDWWRDFV